jgi:hypothetical protein
MAAFPHADAWILIILVALQSSLAPDHRHIWLIDAELMPCIMYLALLGELKNNISALGLVFASVVTIRLHKK